MNTAEPLEINTLPANPDLEESIISGCLLSNELRQDAILYISSQDFYSNRCRVLFDTISAMADASETVDAPSVVEKLKADNRLDKIGGAAEISKLMDAPIPPDVKQYADKIKKYAQLRQIMQICGNTMQECVQSNADRLEDVLNKFQAHALSIGTAKTDSWLTKKELTEQSVDRYQELNEGSALKTIPTGFPTLDRVTGGGFRGSKLIIVAARPRVGKTALMCNLVQNMCRRGHCCGVFSLEMDKSELDDRWIAAGAGVNSIKLTAEPGPDVNEWRRIFDAAQRQGNWKAFIDDGQMDIGGLKRKIRQMVKAGAEIIFIDQLSGITGNRRKDAWERNSEHVEELKFLKKELRIPIVLLAQLNRELEKRNNKKPILSDLKNTGQLEEDADIVLMGHRPYLYPNANGKRDESLRDYGEWEVTKNRQGAEWNIKMNWQEKYQLFKEIAVEYNH